MRIGCIADDFTGATDLGVTLAREGLGVIQTTGVPETAAALPACDAVVVALKSRTAPAAEAVRSSLAAAAWLRSRGAERIYFKYCSTFDSTPQGNIGPVADALMDALGCDFTVATPAYPRNARTVYLGNLFVGDVPLAESGMRDHPLTPMRDSNLVRVLAAQTSRKVGLIPFAAVDRGAQRILDAMAALRRGGASYAVLDAVSDEHLLAAGESCAGLALATGGAGLAMGLARALGRRESAAASLPSVAGPAVLLAGSCSPATLEQVHAASSRYPALRVDPRALDPEGAVRWVKANLGSGAVLIYSSAAPAELVPDRAGEIEAAFRRIASDLAHAGVRRFVVAGGETSGAVVEALGVLALAIGPEIDPGVPWTASIGDDPYLLALKSGNFGSRDFFTKALEMLR